MRGNAHVRFGGRLREKDRAMPTPRPESTPTRSLKMRVAKLAPELRQRDRLVQQLDVVRVAQLVRREPPTDSCPERETVKLDPRRAHARPQVGPSITQNSGPTGSSARSGTHGPIAAQPQASMPTSRRRSFLPCRMRIEPRP
jgi:hypothetical protein